MFAWIVELFADLYILIEQFLFDKKKKDRRKFEEENNLL